MEDERYQHEEEDEDLDEFDEERGLLRRLLPDPRGLLRFLPERDLLPYLSDRWVFSSDLSFTQGLSADVFRHVSQNASLRLCSRCSGADLTRPFSFRQLDKGCDLCTLLEGPSNQNENAIRLTKRPNGWMLCRTAEQGGDPQIPRGLPQLPELGGVAYFDLLRAWLHDCDTSTARHRYCSRKSTTFRPPTRLIDIGLEGSPSSLRLMSDIAENTSYVALSHCWGELGQAIRGQINTSSTNLDERKAGFQMTESFWPQTFRDAIRVTRELGQRYLWIDAICINQSDTDEWERESRRMEKVFENAYCTIAAVSIDDSSEDGFLLPARLERRCVRLDTGSRGTVYVCEDIDRFQADVQDGLLNQRAWVLQERALSRRTIHFTTNQTYWECGIGIRCETLTRMRSGTSTFLSDPRFPAALSRAGIASRVHLSQNLYQRYASLGLTEPSDRRVAILGLEKRLADTFRTKSQYGIFHGAYLHRSLLWQRRGPVRSEPIDYPDSHKVPSWSWMAHDGPIDYMPVAFRQVDWVKPTLPYLQIDVDRLRTQVCRLQACEIAQAVPGTEDGRCTLKDQRGESKGGWWLRLDRENSTKVESIGCVIIGRETSKSGDERLYYVLVVAPLLDGTPVLKEGHQTCQRVGVGSVPQQFLSLEMENGCII